MGDPLRSTQALPARCPQCGNPLRRGTPPGDSTSGAEFDLRIAVN